MKDRSTILLKHITKYPPITIHQTYRTDVDTVRTNLLKYIAEFITMHPKVKVTKYVKIVQDYLVNNKAGIIFIVLCFNGLLSIKALCTIIQMMLDTTTQALDMGTDMILESFAESLAPSLLRTIVFTDILKFFAKYSIISNELKSNIITVMTLSELATFPVYQRYHIQIETDEELEIRINAGVHKALKCALLSYFSGECIYNEECVYKTLLDISRNAEESVVDLLMQTDMAVTALLDGNYDYSSAPSLIREADVSLVEDSIM